MFYTMFYVVLLCAEFATAMDATAMDAKPSRQWWRSRPKTRRILAADPKSRRILAAEDFRAARDHTCEEHFLQVRKMIDKVYPNVSDVFKAVSSFHDMKKEDTDELTLDEVRNYLDLKSAKHRMTYMHANFILKVFACAMADGTQKLDKMGTQQISRRLVPGAASMGFEEYLRVLGLEHLPSRELVAMTTTHQCEILVSSIVQARMSLKASTLARADLIRLLMAALMATFGLGSNNMAAIYGAFLVSPLMKPIIQTVFKVVDTMYAIKFGFGNAYYKFGGTVLDCVMTFLFAIFLNYVVGFVGALLMMISGFSDINKWPTDEMTGRTQTKNNELNFLVAVFCGCALGNGLIDGFRKTMGTDLVGVGIAASLLPPLCNSGMLGAIFVNQRFGLGLDAGGKRYDCSDRHISTTLSADERFEAKKRTESNILIDAKNSTLLTLVNVLGVFLAAVPWFYLDMYDEYTCLHMLKPPLRSTV
jgi:hypothetical protein